MEKELTEFQKKERVRRQLKWRNANRDKFRANETRRMRAKQILRERHFEEYKQILKELRNKEKNNG